MPRAGVLTIRQLHLNLDELDGREEKGLYEAGGGARDREHLVVLETRLVMLVLAIFGRVFGVESVADFLLDAEQDCIYDHGANQRAAHAFVQCIYLDLNKKMNL